MADGVPYYPLNMPMMESTLTVNPYLYSLLAHSAVCAYGNIVKLWSWQTLASSTRNCNNALGEVFIFGSFCVGSFCFTIICPIGVDLFLRLCKLNANVTKSELGQVWPFTRDTTQKNNLKRSSVGPSKITQMFPTRSVNHNFGSVRATRNL